MKRNRPPRCGVNVMELTVALALLAVALTSIAQLGVLVARDRGRARAERLATLAVHNAAEALMRRGYEELSSETIADLIGALPSDDPEVALAVTVDDASDDALRVRRITLVTTNRSRHDVRCELVIWKHAAGGGKP
jgi:type II secretory pathway pseudopilin PulG